MTMFFFVRWQLCLRNKNKKGKGRGKRKERKRRKKDLPLHTLPTVFPIPVTPAAVVGSLVRSPFVVLFVVVSFVVSFPSAALL